MITFLLSPDFALNAFLLDDSRLGKQRLEGAQLVRIIERLQQMQQENFKLESSSTESKTTKPKSVPWAHHPATLMWINHLEALKLYVNACIDEWVRRGRKNTMARYDLCKIERIGDEFHGPEEAKANVETNSTSALP